MRCQPRTRHQRVALQGARPLVNSPATSLKMVQLLEVINKVTHKIGQEEKEADETDLIKDTEDPIEVSSGFSQ